MIETFTRRSFLQVTAGVMAGAACRSLLGEAPAAAGVRIDGSLVVLPSKGRIYIANDFHSRRGDFQRWLKKTDLPAKLRGEEDVYGVVLGDVVDHKAGDREFTPEGDLRIIDEIRRIQGGAGGQRLIYMMGNHEFEVLKLYDMLKRQHGLTARNRDRLVLELYKADYAYYSQWNFLERITDEHAEYLKSRPVCAVRAGSFVLAHAGPSLKVEAARDLVKPAEAVLNDMLWLRPTAPYDHKSPVEGRYDQADVAEFLKRMDKSHLLIVGHTPLSGLPRGWMRNGLARVADNCVVMAASYGALAGQKRYLKLDLAKEYAGADQLQADEVRSLEDGQARRDWGMEEHWQMSYQSVLRRVGGPA